ncbi:DUF551 domain-containing protein [Enterobacter sp. FB]|uniref:DUF551 domain-containing protein n=1 Tax=Enterobacter sp. FB TaxID=1571816 RepID=UPI000A4FAB77|nr:DUF551 domain-containing protein [Enterobacter sp. FB]
MRTITKEWLESQISAIKAVGITDSNTLQAFEIALASLEADPVGFIDAEYAELLKSGHIESCSAYAEPGEGCITLYTAPPSPANSEPVAWMWERDGKRDVDMDNPDEEINLIGAKKAMDAGWKCNPLYTAPPAPVSVPDLKELEAVLNWILMLPCPTPKATYFAKKLAVVIDTCRNAMLQGADNELQRKAEIHDALCEKYNVESLTDFVDWQRNHIAELEAAPPAPVGPGETAVMPDYPGYTMTQRECYQAGKKAGMDEAGNSPAIPDGWVACSERMPPLKTGVIVGKWIGRSWATKWATYIPSHPEANSHGFIMPGGSWEPTHWMPIPAAPQQEA